MSEQMKSNNQEVFGQTDTGEETIVLSEAQLEEAKRILGVGGVADDCNSKDEENQLGTNADSSGDLLPLVTDSQADREKINSTFPCATSVEGKQQHNSSETCIKISPEEFQLLKQLKDEQRQWRIDRKVAALGSEYTPRRNTLILRRALKLHPNLVPKEDVVAYSEIYKLREAVTAKGKKVQVSDEEIQAYHKLEDLALPVTLEAIMEYAIQA